MLSAAVDLPAGKGRKTCFLSLFAGHFLLHSLATELKIGEK